MPQYFLPEPSYAKYCLEGKAVRQHNMLWRLNKVYVKGPVKEGFKDLI